MKEVMHDTMACDPCWEAGMKVHKQLDEALRRGEKAVVPKEWDGSMTRAEVEEKEKT
jgi:hypothetical protein